MYCRLLTQRALSLSLSLSSASPQLSFRPSILSLSLSLSVFIWLSSSSSAAAAAAASNQCFHGSLLPPWIEEEPRFTLISSQISLEFPPLPLLSQEKLEKCGSPVKAQKKGEKDRQRERKKYCVYSSENLSVFRSIHGEIKRRKTIYTVQKGLFYFLFQINEFNQKRPVERK